MIINESDEKREKRLREYLICKKRGHMAEYGFGPYSVCSYCGVHYQFVLQEEITTVPTGVNEQIPETNMTQWAERSLNGESQ